MNTSGSKLTLNSLKAHQQNKNIVVEWKVENESGIKDYEIEKSKDGTIFTKVALQPATGNNMSFVTYLWLDVAPLPGNNFYRIRSTSISGKIEYSQVIKITISSKSRFEIYPNPVTNGRIQMQFINKVEGVYLLRLLNTNGQVMLIDQVSHKAGSSIEEIKFNSNITKGRHMLEITAPDKSRQTIKIIY